MTGAPRPTSTPSQCSPYAFAPNCESASSAIPSSPGTPWQRSSRLRSLVTWTKKKRSETPPSGSVAGARPLRFRLRVRLLRLPLTAAPSAAGRRDVEVMARGNPTDDLLQWNVAPFRSYPAVDHDGEGRVLPQRRLPPSGVAEQIGLHSPTHARGCVEGVLTVAVLDASPEPHLGQPALPQPFVLERLGPGRAGEVERRDGEFEQRDVGRELAGHVTR